MKAAIYARKSKDTEKGESMDSQIRRCISLCEMRDWEYEIYQDFDISGATLDRPDFERMMKDIHQNKYTALICYKLDRVSRSTSDFSNLIRELDEINVDFISIKENFDLSTPMGRAMMMITSVFAQLERETIAERVRDNMIDRAKLGKWNGGVVPIGYDSITETTQIGDRIKKSSKLVIDEYDSDIVREIFNNYLENGESIRSTAFYMNDSGFTTKNGSMWRSNQISRVLQNAVYCVADKAAYSYFTNKTDVNVIDDIEDFNGEYGLMFYNRRKAHKKTTREREQSDWILAVGEHQGIIPGETFVKAQTKILSNRTATPVSYSTKSPLVGLVYCAECGGKMTLTSSRQNTKTKDYYHYFSCKAYSSKKCSTPNVRADLLENLAIERIFELIKNETLVDELLEHKTSTIDDNRVPLLAERNKLGRRKKQIERELNNLLDALANNVLPDMVIQKKYKELESEKKELNIRLDEVEYKLNETSIESYNIDNFKEYLSDFLSTYLYLNVEERRKLLSHLVKDITIYDDYFEVRLFTSLQDLY